MTRETVTTAELMAVCMSRWLRDADIVQLGLASPLGTIAALLARRLSLRRLLLVDPAALTLSGAARGASLAQAEAVALSGSLRRFEVSEWVTETMPGLAGRVRQFIRPLQVDVHGRINTLRARRADGWLRVAGLAGLAELAEVADPFLLYLARQDRRAFVDAVDFSTCAPLERPGNEAGTIVIVTDLAVFEVSRSGARAVSVHPGVSHEELARVTPAIVDIDGAVETTPPASEELGVLRLEVDRRGLRDLEFLHGEERLERLRAIVVQETDAVRTTQGPAQSTASGGGA